MTYLKSGAVLPAAMLLVLAVNAAADSLQASLDSPDWDGKRIPQNQRCESFGGVNPMTPQLKITGIPDGTEAVILRFNDESHQQMRNGGHGIIGMLVEAETDEMVFPSIPGHTFELPEGVFMVRAHKGTRWGLKEGAYLPPCSGGRGHRYSVTVQASTVKNMEKKKFKKIARAKVTLGRY